MKQLILLALLASNFSLIAQESISNIQQSNISKTSFTLAWESPQKGISAVRYGKTPDLELGLQYNSNKNYTQHQVELKNLQSTTFYYVQPLIINNQDTTIGALGYYSTQSTSSGTMRIMFNQGIDPTYSNGSTPYILTGGGNIENEIINMINQATTSIDIAVYNNTRSAIVNALDNAHNNGVQVRYIANSGSATSNAALSPAPSFPVFYVNTNDLMHNKFMVIDANSSNNAWVWTGSCNWTYTDMYTNYNNLVAIQDQALAQAYTIEFEEMWGSSGANYNSSNAKAGSLKTDNTPHTFNIGGKMVELYFSPSDNTTSKIESTLYNADNDIEFSLLAFTKNELGTAIRNQHQAGILEHGMMENINDFGSEFNWLSGQGVNILADNHATDLHHKYVIVDAGDIGSDPMVLTGSHNWTTAAEERNDENTLIIHDKDVANLFLQEFTQRWCEVKNNTNCGLPFTPLNQTVISATTTDINLYPNPVQNQCTLQFHQAPSSNTVVQLYTATGQIIETYHLQPAMEQTLNLNAIPNGFYVMVISNNKKQWRLPISVVH